MQELSKSYEEMLHLDMFLYVGTTSEFDLLSGIGKSSQLVTCSGSATEVRSLNAFR